LVWFFVNDDMVVFVFGFVEIGLGVVFLVWGCGWVIVGFVVVVFFVVVFFGNIV